MGGKGQRRREKNYAAAHGGSTRLPPPPDSASLDVLPSKLRKLLALSEVGRRRSSGDKRNSGVEADKEFFSGKERDSAARETQVGRNDRKSTAHQFKLTDQTLQLGSHEKKKKRKRKAVNDLRFESVEASGVASSKRKERKKQRLEARKKKHKRAKVEESVDFRGREEIQFGEVVEAPPKLNAIPKALKTTMNASQERLRLQFIDSYRQRKGWKSKLGVQLPSPVTTPLL